MRRSTRFGMALAFLAFLILLSCSKSDRWDCTKVGRASLISIHSRDSGFVHDSLRIPVVSTCATNFGGNFNSFKPATASSSGKVEVLANYDVCGPGGAGRLGVLIRQDFIFYSDVPGVYYLDFLQPDDSYLTDTILIR
jgi:hypothetical protein